MTSREVKKELMSFIKREVKEKSADWGELRRIKRHVILKKGLPNVPNLVIQTDSGLSYMGVIQWKNELRVYLFDTKGQMLHGESYFQAIQEVYKDLRSKSKKIARYPTIKKEISISQRNYQLDKRFHQIWTQLAKKMNVPQKYRHERPLIKGIVHPTEDIFGTKLEKGFIYVPFESTKLMTVFTYYSLISFLPPPIRRNSDIAEALSFLMLRSFKQFRDEPIIQNRPSSPIIPQIAPWGVLRPAMILNILNKISRYFDSPWNTQDFIFLAKLPINNVRNLSRQKIPTLFCLLFRISQNADFLVLANLLGLPFGIECPIPVELSENTTLKLYSWLKNWQLTKLLPYVNQSTLTKGQLLAFEEALNFQYAKVLDLNLISAKFGKFEIVNKSDLPIILTEIIQVLPDGNERELSFQKVVLPPYETHSFSLKSIKISVEFPIRVQYQLIKSLKDNVQPLFIGTLVF
ncbi:MAG: hypothetical protein ACFE95_05165 [Candidatus Hodarchaeota archaeon]